MLKKIALASLFVVCASFGIAGTVAASQGYDELRSSPWSSSRRPRAYACRATGA